MKESIKYKALTVVIAISGVVVIESIALSKGINGIALTASISTIALMVGWLLGKKLPASNSDHVRD